MGRVREIDRKIELDMESRVGSNNNMWYADYDAMACAKLARSCSSF